MTLSDYCWYIKIHLISVYWTYIQRFSYISFILLTCLYIRLDTCVYSYITMLSLDNSYFFLSDPYFLFFFSPIAPTRILSTVFSRNSNSEYPCFLLISEGKHFNNLSMILLFFCRYFIKIKFSFITIIMS